MRGAQKEKFPSLIVENNYGAISGHAPLHSIIFIIVVVAYCTRFNSGLLNECIGHWRVLWAISAVNYNYNNKLHISLNILLPLLLQSMETDLHATNAFFSVHILLIV